MRDRIYTEEMGQPPVDIDMGSVEMERPRNMAGSKRRPGEPAPKKKAKKMAKGGSVSGKAMRGNPKCKMY